jgi:sulfatase modifying factor 1
MTSHPTPVRPRRRLLKLVAALAALAATHGLVLLTKWLLESVPPVGADDCAAMPAHGCMVLVPGGRFLMGAQATDPAAPNYDPDAQPHEGPVHEVELPPLWMHQFEVAASDYRSCINKKACWPQDVRTGVAFSFEDSGRYTWPLNGVKWRGAHDYCAFIGGRLPTEAEWEFVARAGASSRWITSDVRPRCPRAIVDGGCGTGHPTHASGGYTAEPFGIGNLAGNVWEWTADWYAPDYYARSPRFAPRGPDAGTARVQRGGGWSTTEDDEMRSAHRAALEPELQLDDVGFRCAADVAPRWARLYQRLTSPTPLGAPNR